jgi:tRNA threonylcarbamoyladenosine biosynthesis protein TsaE
MTILEQLREGVATGSAGETRTLACALAAVLPPDTALALHGTLGVGKTTFVQGLAEGLGVTGAVTSPTFTIYNLLRGTRALLVHVDAYRLKDDRGLDGLMIEDFLTSPWCLAVEWPERVSAWLPATAWHLELGIASDGRHTVRLL